jgi:hypothetical protein
VGHTFLQVGPDGYDKRDQMVMTSGTSQLTSGTRHYDKWGPHFHDKWDPQLLPYGSILW